MKRLHAEQELTIKAMREDQERAVKELREQTERIGNDAASLTQALKGDSKMQGDWGEMILDKTLGRLRSYSGATVFSARELQRQGR